jgi:hypothetical protein
MLFADKLKALSTTSKPVVGSGPEPEVNPQQAISSRVEAVAHCEALMQFFESQGNKAGAECMRTAINSIYAPKE